MVSSGVSYGDKMAGGEKSAQMRGWCSVWEG